MVKKVKSAMGSCLNINLSYVTIEIILIIIVLLVAIYLVYKQHRNFKNKETFNSELPTFSMYFTEWCGHSRTMNPVFDSLKDNFAGRIDFVKYDCDEQESGKAQCKENNIKFLPTLLYRKTAQSDPVKYSGGPNIEVLTEFLNTQLAS